MRRHLFFFIIAFIIIAFSSCNKGGGAPHAAVMKEFISTGEDSSGVVDNTMIFQKSDTSAASGMTTSPVTEKPERVIDTTDVMRNASSETFDGFEIPRGAQINSVNPLSAANELRIGSFLSGNLNSGNEIWYRVRTANACILTVETESNIDTYLEVYDAQMNLISENDDGINSNARINLIAQANAVYLFKLRGYNSYINGPFRILADSKSVTELREDTIVNGNIISGQENWYSVRASRSGYLIVETSGVVDTILEAFNENNDSLLWDDDSTGTVNAKVRIHATAGKLYYFLLKSRGNGAYRILAGSSAYPASTVLNIGSFLNGNVTPGSEYWYTVRAEQSGSLTVETLGNTNIYIDVYDENYKHITSDQGSEYPNSKVIIYISTGKTYYFILRGAMTDTSGAFRILASFQPFPSPIPLAAGSFHNGNIEQGKEIWYSVRPARNGRLTVETTGNTDTALDAYINDYEHFASNDDNYADNIVNRNAKIIFPNANANTVYIFKLTCYNSGPYRIFAYLE